MKKVLKLAVTLLMLWIEGMLCISVLPARAQQAQTLDYIVVIVNDDVITYREWQDAIVYFKRRLIAAHVAMPPAAQFARQVLQQLIDQLLQLRLAVQSGIKLPQGEVERAVQNIAKNYHMSQTIFYQSLRRQGIERQQYEEFMRRQLIIGKLQQQVVLSRITVTNAEVQQTWHQLQSAQARGQSYHLKDIVFVLPDMAAKMERSRALQAAERLLLAGREGGKSFATLVATRQRYGWQDVRYIDLGWRSAAALPTVFIAPVRRMQVQELAGPIRASNGLHILYLTATHLPETAPSLAQAEHLLLQQKAEEAIQNWLSELRSQAFIRYLTS